MRIAIIVTVFTLLFSACGGGGSQTSVPDEPTQETDPDEPTQVTVPDEPTQVTVPNKPTQVTTIQTYEFGRLTPGAFRLKRAELAEDIKDEESFEEQWGLEAINAHQAYANLRLAKGPGERPGYGTTVSFIDTGVNEGDPSLSSFLPGQNKLELLYGTENEDGTARSHGTAVLSVVGAAPDSWTDMNTTNPDLIELNFQGVAWAANWVMVAIPLGSDDPNLPYDPVSLSSLSNSDQYFETLIKIASGQDPNYPSISNIDVLNLSFGFSGIIDNYTETDLRANFSNTIDALEQQNVSEKTIVVIAGGNANNDLCTTGTPNCVQDKIDATSVEIFPGLPVRIPELRGHVIAVVAAKMDGTIADFSNRCGIVANWCITAPGQDVSIAYFGPHPTLPNTPAEGISTTGRGTSFAAPFVSGGLALMKQMFRGQLSSTALVTRLYSTANKTGVYANSSIYGQGLMDLGAATSPVGVATLQLGDSVGGNGSDIRSTSIRLGSAFGDGFGRSLAGMEIVTFDQLGAPFWFSINGLTQQTTPESAQTQLLNLLSQRQSTQYIADQRVSFTPGRVGGTIEHFSGIPQLQLGILEPLNGDKNGHMSLAEKSITLGLTGINGSAVKAFTTHGISGVKPVSGITFSWRPNGRHLIFDTGWLAEKSSLLGTDATGGFGRFTSNSIFSGIRSEFGFNDWQITATAEMGMAVPNYQKSIIRRVTPLLSSAYKLSGKRHLENGGSFSISLSQPLRVEKGKTSLSIPVGRTKAGGILFSQATADLTPSGRQSNLAFDWYQPITRNSEILLNTTWIHEPGHSKSVNDELRVMAGWSSKF